MGEDVTLPPGFRFHPTDEELVSYYLKRKISGKSFNLNAISEVDLYKIEPWDLPGKSCLKNRDLEWYFFSPLDKKYGIGARTNRATKQGYWKVTGKDRDVRGKSKKMGLKKTLVFHQGRAPRGERTNWVMHEYRLVDDELSKAGIQHNPFVLCRVFKKSGPGPKTSEQYGAPLVEEEWDENVVPESGLLALSMFSNPAPSSSESPQSSDHGERQPVPYGISPLDGLDQDLPSCEFYRHWFEVHEWYETLATFQKALVRQMGFGHFLDIKPFRLDKRLLDAGIEWWMPKTNSFHFITGEMSLTMEDVVRIAGLSIAGEPVVGRKENDYIAISVELLGQPYPAQGARKGLIELGWLRKTFMEKRPNEGEVAANHQLRAFIMFLFGSTIFRDMSGKMVDGIFLQFLSDLNRVRAYSWGSAMLAFLYRALYSRKIDKASSIEGFFPLIQVWLYEHINIGRPHLKENTPNLFPRARHWEEKYQEGDMHHHGTFFRQEFSLITPQQIMWRPYKVGEDADVVVVQESEPLFIREIWMICAEKIERHMPGRVLRQYGLPQSIPKDPVGHNRMSMVGGKEHDYTKLYQLEIADWLSGGVAVQGPTKDTHVDEVAYEEWYSSMSKGNVLPSELLGEAFYPTLGIGDSTTNAYKEENAKLKADLARVTIERDTATSDTRIRRESASPALEFDEDERCDYFENGGGSFEELHSRPKFLNVLEENNDLSELNQMRPAFEDGSYLEFNNPLNDAEYPADETVGDHLEYFDAPRIRNPLINDGSFLEMNDLLNPKEPEPSGFEMLDELLAFFDATDSNLNKADFISNQSDLAPQVLGQACQSFSNAHGAEDASSEQKPETCYGSWDEDLNAKGARVEADVKYNKKGSWDDGTLSKSVGSIPAHPTALATPEYPMKGAKSAVGASCSSPGSVHVTAATIHITGVTLTGGNGKDMPSSLQSLKIRNIGSLLVSFCLLGIRNDGDLAMAATYPLLVGRISFGFVPAIESDALETGITMMLWSGFYLFFLSVLMSLAASFKLGSYIYTR